MIYLKWLLYLMVTQDARARYATGKLKGFQCTSLKHSATGTLITYDKNSKPTREYLNWEEFKKIQKEK